MRPRTQLVLWLAGLLLAGCAATGSGETPVTSAAPSGSSSPVAFQLFTHCGVNELQYGSTWFARDGGPLTDGTGNPPSGWDNPSQAGQLVVEGEKATFTDSQGHRETFSARRGATAPLQVCS